MKKLIDIYEGILNDIDSTLECGDLIALLDTPRFGKRELNKIIKILKKAGGEDYDEAKHKDDETTYFIVFQKGGLADTSSVYIGTNRNKFVRNTDRPLFQRIYYPYHNEYQNSYQPKPHQWIETPNSAHHYIYNGARGKDLCTYPVSIPEKYWSLIEYLFSVSDKQYYHA